MNKHNCGECKYYNGHLDRCEKWDFIVDDREVHECYCVTTITSSNYIISGTYLPNNGVITVSGMYGATNAKVRKKCVYCDCLNDTEYGTCKYCGAPLGVVEE